MKYLKPAIILFIILSITLVLAQDSCSTFATDALTTLDTICEPTGRNELCYGNTEVSVTTITGDDLAFSQPGDIISILDIESITSSPFAEPDEWGIALMQIQANIPDSLPGQNVTFLLFGDVNLANAGSVSANLIASTTGNINIRSGSSTNYAVAGSLSDDTEIELIGRNATGDWVFFTTEDISGWLFASLLQIDGDVMTLDEVADDFAGTSSAAPMQAIYFSSGIGELTCNEVPRDGILIQTPEYEGAIQLIINDVEIQLSSTVYLQAERGHAMWIYVLEGQAIVLANGEAEAVPEGAFLWIPIDEELKVSGTPNEPEPYELETLETLPISALPQEISISQAASIADIQGLNECRASVTGIVNMRGGPGTRYSVAESVDESDSLIVVKQTVGSDGYIWYKLLSSAELWVRSDLITLGNNCDGIPITNNIPPTPTSDPSGNWVQYLVNFCSGTGNGQPIYEGMNVRFNMGCCGQATAEANDAMTGGNTGWITLDGVRLDVNYTPSRLMTEGFYSSEVSVTWVATSGTHTVAAGWPRSGQPVCIFTVE